MGRIKACGRVALAAPTTGRGLLALQRPQRATITAIAAVFKLLISALQLLGGCWQGLAGVEGALPGPGTRQEAGQEV
jgi:hypothetical protein